MDHEQLSKRVEEAQAGDPEAFGELVLATWESLVALARVTLAERSGEAEDVVQDAYHQAWIALPRLRNPGAFHGWLQRITVRRALRYLSKEPPRNANVEAPVASPNQCDGDLERALGELAPRQRAVLYLGEIRGLSDRAIAASLGIGVSTVRVHRQRGRLRLRQLLDGGHKNGGPETVRGSS